MLHVIKMAPLNLGDSHSLKLSKFTIYSALSRSGEKGYMLQSLRVQRTVYAVFS